MASSQVFDSLLSWDLEGVIIVSNKLDVSTVDLPERVEVVSQSDIQHSSANRLSEILTQVNGLFIDAEFGDGVQMQGLGSDYTMILLDGVPLIGRKGGVFDLERIAVNDIERVEILKGPYSTLYGSEALAGIINIITKNNKKKSAQLEMGIRSNEVFDISTHHVKDFETFRIKGGAGYRKSVGFNVLPDQQGYRLPPYEQYHGNFGLTLKPGQQNKWDLNYRIFREDQEESYNFTGVDVEGRTIIQDHILSLSHSNVYGESVNVVHTLFTEYYNQKQDLLNAVSGEIIDEDDFMHLQVRWISDGDWYINDDTKLSFGGGTLLNQVETNRYEEGQNEWNVFGYGQLKKSWSDYEAVGGFRWDWNSQSGAAVTGSLALNKSWSDKLKTSISIGSGYKLPDYRQKYLSYTNATVGYSIVGTEALYFYEELISAGVIALELEDPGQAGPLKSEYSWSYSGNVAYRPDPNVQVKVSVFRNALTDLIDTYIIAQKTNGLFVYSYRNFDEIVTQGMETTVKANLGNFDVSGGYQFLDTKDRKVWQEIVDGNVYGRKPGELNSYRVSRSDYGGLFNRSRHSGQFKLGYTLSEPGINAFLQTFYKGRFGRYDLDGNNILNLDEEYIKSYAKFNLGLSKNWSVLSVTIGVDNVFDFTNPVDIPTEQGRIFWTRIKLDINNKN
jgi:outer membrane receptor for ferrienterochelin and colicins